MTATVQKVEVIPLKGVKLLCNDGDSIEINFDMPRQEVRQRIKEKVGVEPEELEHFAKPESSDSFEFICTSISVSYNYAKGQTIEAVEINGGEANFLSKSFFGVPFETVKDWFAELDQQMVYVQSSKAIYSPKLLCVSGANDTGDSAETLLVCTQDYWSDLASYVHINERQGGEMDA